MRANCVICTELFDGASRVVSTPCGHILHEICCAQWIRRSKTCPECRRKMTMRSVVHLYFNFEGEELRDDTNELKNELERAKADLQLREMEKRELIADLDNLRKAGSSAENQDWNWQGKVHTGKLIQKLKNELETVKRVLKLKVAEKNGLVLNMDSLRKAATSAEELAESNRRMLLDCQAQAAAADLQLGKLKKELETPEGDLNLKDMEIHKLLLDMNDLRRAVASAENRANFNNSLFLDCQSHLNSVMQRFDKIKKELDVANADLKAKELEMKGLRRALAYAENRTETNRKKLLDFHSGATATLEQINECCIDQLLKYEQNIIDDSPFKDEQNNIDGLHFKDEQNIIEGSHFKDEQSIIDDHPTTVNNNTANRTSGSKNFKITTRHFQPHSNQASCSSNNNEITARAIVTEDLRIFVNDCQENRAHSSLASVSEIFGSALITKDLHNSQESPENEEEFVPKNLKTEGFEESEEFNTSLQAVETAKRKSTFENVSPLVLKSVHGSVPTPYKKPKILESVFSRISTPRKKQVSRKKKVADKDYTPHKRIKIEPVPSDIMVVQKESVLEVPKDETTACAHCMKDIVEITID